MLLVLDGFEGTSYKRVHEVQLFGGVPILGEIMSMLFMAYIEELYLLYGPELLVKLLFFIGCSITLFAVIATLIMNDRPMD